MLVRCRDRTDQENRGGQKAAKKQSLSVQCWKDLTCAVWYNKGSTLRRGG